MGLMATLMLVSEHLGGRIVWVSPTHGRCGSGQIPWEEVRLVASVVNIRVLDGAEIPPFIYSDKGGKGGFPRVRVFDESGGEIKNIPTRSWDSLDYDETDAGSERGSVAPSFAPREEGMKALWILAPHHHIIQKARVLSSIRGAKNHIGCIS